MEKHEYRTQASEPCSSSQALSREAELRVLEGKWVGGARVRAGAAGGVAGLGVKARRRLGNMLVDLCPPQPDSICSHHSLQGPLIAVIMRDLDVCCQGLRIPARLNSFNGI